MFKRGTCKFYNGDYHNECCEAGVNYRAVTTDPDVIDGSAFRKPCINWATFYADKGKPAFDNDVQRENWARRGHCEKRQEPTDAEIAESEAEIKRVTAQFVNDIAEGRLIGCVRR